MSGMYPDNEEIELFGETVLWPNLGEDGKFTDGSFKDLLKKPSYIPAQTINLILDNMADIIIANGKTPNNKDKNQLTAAFAAALALKANLANPTFTGIVKVSNKTTDATKDGTLIATEAQVALKANIESPTFTGNPLVPAKSTPADNYPTRIATEQQVKTVADAVATKKNPVTLVIGNTAAGHTASDVHYLCTGTNDQLVINNAINALPEWGGEILIREGKYNLGGQININKDNVTIRGMGAATVLNCTAYVSDVLYITRSYCKITRLKITNATGGYSSCGVRTALASSSNNTINENIFGLSSDMSDQKTYAIYLSNGNNTVKGNIFNNAETGDESHSCGVYIANGSNNVISRNKFNNKGALYSYGIYLDTGSNGNDITGNRFNNEGNYNYGVYVVSGANGGGNNITGNRFNNSGNNNSYAVYLGSGGGNTVTGNRFNNGGNGTCAVYVSSARNIVSNNTATAGGSSSFFMFHITASAANCIFLGNNAFFNTRPLSSYIWTSNGVVGSLTPPAGSESTAGVFGSNNVCGFTSLVV
jgi:hypothetical protein